MPRPGPSFTGRTSTPPLSCSSEGNVPVERAAALMETLLGTPVSSGFVARALARLAQRLQAAGFEEAMKDALQAEDVLCSDETPANVISNDTGPDGEAVPGAPHAVTIRTPDARLIWYAALGSRSSTAIAGLDVLEGWHGYLSATTTRAGISSMPGSPASSNAVLT
jgi:transposase